MRLCIRLASICDFKSNLISFPYLTLSLTIWPCTPWCKVVRFYIIRLGKHKKSHPLDQSLTDLNARVQTRSRLKIFCAFYAFLSLTEPTNVYEALTDSDWIVAMRDELHQFERNQV